MRSRTFWILLLAALAAGALAAGALIGWIDSRPHWDDTGVTVGMILIATTPLGVIAPKRAWLWALAAGCPIALLGLMASGNSGSAAAIVVAFAGAYLGAALRATPAFPSKQRGRHDPH